MISLFLSFRSVRRAGALLVCAALLVSVVHGQTAEVVAGMEELVQNRVAAHEFSGAVLVAQRGKVLFDRAYGQANREWEIANTPATRFRIGSITKQFTAVSILLLEERGKLKLTDLVSQHVPDTPAAWSKITLRHLLTHTSGLTNVTDLPEFILWKNSPSTPTQMVARFSELPLDFQPGERFAYSNSNYLVLGLIVERVGGQRYGGFLREHVLDPLGLKDTGLDSNLTVLPRRATGYGYRDGNYLNAPHSDMSVPHGAGAMYSTTHDLWRWAEGVFVDQLLTPASRAKLLTPEKDGYALGVRVYEQRGRKVIEHGGAIAGFSSALRYYPADGVTIVVLSNLGRSITAEMSSELASAWFDGARPQVTVPVATLQSYAGVYSVSPDRFFTIRLVEGKLMARLGRQEESHELVADSETLFYLKPIDGQIEFVRDGAGKVTEIAVHQKGRVTRKLPRDAD